VSIHPLDRPAGEIDLIETLGGLAAGGPVRPTHTSLAAVDICAFGSRRDEDVQLHLRAKMYEFLADAFDMTRLPWSGSYREDRGDGALIILPPAVLADTLLDPLANHLHALLRRNNRLANDVARLRLRVAVHAGDVHRDANGVAGHAVIHLFRLLEASRFKKLLAAGDADLGLIVSDQLYQATTHRAGLVDADAYQQINVRRKETRTKAWVWLPPQPCARP
jgi:hypothetical protein